MISPTEINDIIIDANSTNAILGCTTTRENPREMTDCSFLPYLVLCSRQHAIKGIMINCGIARGQHQGHEGEENQLNKERLEALRSFNLENWQLGR